VRGRFEKTLPDAKRGGQVMEYDQGTKRQDQGKSKIERRWVKSVTVSIALSGSLTCKKRRGRLRAKGPKTRKGRRLPNPKNITKSRDRSRTCQLFSKRRSKQGKKKSCQGPETPRVSSAR